MSRFARPIVHRTFWIRFFRAQCGANRRFWVLIAISLLSVADLLWSAAAQAKDFPYPEGKVLTRAEAEKLQDWFPAPFWEYRHLFFHDAMKMTIGPTQRDYSPAPVYQRATEKHRGKARLGPDGSLEAYHSGQPFPVDTISCQSDPDAGVKWIWNYVYRWQGAGLKTTFRYTYWDRGERLPLFYEGNMSGWQLKHRPEPEYEKQGGDVFSNEARTWVVGFEMENPPEAKGMRFLTNRYAQSFGPLATAIPEETWVYARQVRRVRKISETQRSAAVAGTDFTFDDLFTFSGLPPQYRWKCLGEAKVLAPMNTLVQGYPYSSEEQFGPMGLSYVDDRWEVRRAMRLVLTPKDDTHPYSKKEIWLDVQTLEPLYSFAYDRTGALWKVIYHNHRWSEDDLGPIRARDWYPSWNGVPEPRDLRIISEVVANVQTGTGNRLDFWDAHGTPLSDGKLKRYVSIERLRGGN